MPPDSYDGGAHPLPLEVSPCRRSSTTARPQAVESKPDPKLEHPADAIVQIDTATICGTDLHILKGDVPTCAEGRTLGHEAVGTRWRPATASRTSRRATGSWSPCIFGLRPLPLLPGGGCTGSARAAG